MPSIDQVSRLNRRMLFYAHRHNRLVIQNQKPGLTRYIVHPTGRMIRGNTPGDLQYQELLAMKAVHDNLEATWRVKIYDNFIPATSGRYGQRTSYEFEWDDEEILVATRKSQLVTGAPNPELGDMIDHFYLPDDVAWVPEMQYATEYVTPGDLVYFMGALAQKMARVDSGRQPYREPRVSKYLDNVAE